MTLINKKCFALCCVDTEGNTVPRAFFTSEEEIELYLGSMASWVKKEDIVFYFDNEDEKVELISPITLVYRINNACVVFTTDKKIGNKYCRSYINTIYGEYNFYIIKPWTLTMSPMIIKESEEK